MLSINTPKLYIKLISHEHKGPIANCIRVNIIIEVIRGMNNIAFADPKIVGSLRCLIIALVKYSCYYSTYYCSKNPELPPTAIIPTTRPLIRAGLPAIANAVNIAKT